MARTDIFVSYSHFDNWWLEELKRYFKPLERSERVALWDDTRIQPGEEWQNEIKEALQRAKIAILLVSQNFINSDFIRNNELPNILKAERECGLKIFWLQIEPSTRCSSIAKFQAA